MKDELTALVKSDFSQARRKAFLRRIQHFLGGGDRLLSYDEVKGKLRIGGPIYQGIKTVPLKKIVGSLNRYHQFDRAFLPLEDQIAERWENVDRAYYQDVNLPPVVLYKVGEVYFVVDGHHRVSVARKQGQEFIEAEVRECSTKVNITADIKPEDLEILGEKVDFLERTSLDRLYPKAKIKLTLPGGFDRMLEHIAVHRYFMGLDFRRDISEEEAIQHWYEKVYKPITGVIRRSNILKDFPGKTEGDLYIWVLDRQRMLSSQGQKLKSPTRAAQEFVSKKK